MIKVKTITDEDEFNLERKIDIFCVNKNILETQYVTLPFGYGAIITYKESSE